MADEKNMELNDEALEEVTGGEGEDSRKKPDPMYDFGDTVVVRGKLWLGEATIRDRRYTSGTWRYDLRFKNWPDVTHPNHDMYGKNLKETAIYCP